MRAIISTTQEIQDDSDLHQKGIKAAGAIGSLLIGSATGGIGLAAAGFLAGMPVEDRAENANNVQDIAEQREMFMKGIYNAKGCYGPFDFDNPVIDAKEDSPNKDITVSAQADTEAFRFNN